MSLQVTLTTGRHHSVMIQGDFTGPYINLEINAETAYGLLQALERHRSELRDMAQNYYECSECGETHSKSAPSCLEAEE